GGRVSDQPDHSAQCSDGSRSAADDQSGQLRSHRQLARSGLTKKSESEARSQNHGERDMKLVQTFLVCAFALTPVLLAQRWEFGGGVGGGFYTSRDITAGSGSVSANIQTNIAGSAWLDNNSR